MRSKERFSRQRGRTNITEIRPLMKPMAFKLSLVKISESQINPSSWPPRLPESAVHSPQRAGFASASIPGWRMPRQAGRAQQELAGLGSLRRRQGARGTPAPPLPGDQVLGRCQILPDLLPLLASPSRTLQTASPDEDGHGCRLLPAHFPFPALSLSQGSSGKLAESDIFHALDSSAGWLSLPVLSCLFCSWSPRPRRRGSIWSTGCCSFTT